MIGIPISTFNFYLMRYLSILSFISFFFCLKKSRYIQLVLRTQKTLMIIIRHKLNKKKKKIEEELKEPYTDR